MTPADRRRLRDAANRHNRPAFYVSTRYDGDVVRVPQYGVCPVTSYGDNSRLDRVVYVSYPRGWRYEPGRQR